MPLPLSGYRPLIFLILICLLSPWTVRAAGTDSSAGPASRTLTKLVVSDIRTDTRQGTTIFSFRISQEEAPPKTFKVPIVIKTGIGVFHYTRAIHSRHADLAFALPDPPLSLVIDPQQKLARELTPAEIPPLWSHFFQLKKKTVVLNSPKDKTIYAPFLDALPGKVTILAADDFKNAMLSKADLIFLGTDNEAARGLFGQPYQSGRGFNLTVYHNPLAPGLLAVRAASSSRKQTRTAVRTLVKRGNFSAIRIQNGRIIAKSRQKAESGQIYSLEHLPAGIPAAATLNFSQVIDRLAAARVVYVGEIHNSTADHRLELRIIEALYKRHPDLAIGMEMFPGSSQKALDAYIKGDTGMSEKEFLKKSKYFYTWGYDYRLFRGIFNFARSYRIPVIGLNIDHKVVSHIFKTGSTDGLTPKQRQQLPADRDLIMTGYAGQLRKILNIHTGELHVHGTAAGFIQAQAVWDETMAANIAAYLVSHPTTRMVVLAGVQHVRIDSGIPPRVKRRLAVRQITVANMASVDQSDDWRGIADYYLMEQAPSLPPLAKIGIVLEEGKTKKKNRVRIDGFSPHGNAAQSGIEKGDIILAIDGNPVYDMDDVKIIMLDVKAGATVMVRIKRKAGSERPLEKTFAVKTWSFSLDHSWPKFRHGTMSGP